MLQLMIRYQVYILGTEIIISQANFNKQKPHLVLRPNLVLYSVPIANVFINVSPVAVPRGKFPYIFLAVVMGAMAVVIVLLKWLK